MNKVNYLRPFRKFCMSIGAIPTSYLESMSYYEMIEWLCRYLSEQVIPTVNNNSEVVKELQDYVAHYFDNLDVQDEINNKLDAMAEDGTLGDIISVYIDSKLARNYLTVSAMKSDNSLQGGMYANTIGYYEHGDGGEGSYYITSRTPQGHYEELDNGLYAELIVKNNTINIKQLGARHQAINNTKYDIKDYIDEYINIIKNTDKEYKLYIPSGVYYSSPIDIAIDKQIYIYGDESFTLHDGGTIITTLNSNQEYLLHLGNQVVYTRHFTIKNLVLSSADYTYNSTTKKYVASLEKSVTSELFKMLQCNFGLIDNIFFSHVSGRCMYMTTSWEVYFGKLNFRTINAIDTSILCFGSIVRSLASSPNISACTFENLMFEATVGDLIEFERECSFLNSVFNNINFEDHTVGDFVYRTDLNNLGDYIKESVFKVDGGATVEMMVNNLFINNLGQKYVVYGDNHYCYDTIVNVPDNNATNSFFDCIINNIQICGMNKDCYFLYSHSTFLYRSGLVINNCTTNYSDTYVLKYDVVKFPRIVTGNFIFNGVNSQRNRRMYKLKGKLQSMFERGVSYGTVTSDDNAYSELGLCNNLDGTHTSNVIATDGVNNIVVRAKIPSGRSVTFTTYGVDRYSTYTATGTGNFEVYTIPLDSDTVLGEPISLQTNNSGNNDILIDWYYFN